MAKKTSLSVSRHTSRVRLSVAAADVFAWHARQGAFERLSPPWETIRLLSPAAGIEPGTRVEFRCSVGPLSATWLVEHGDYEPGKQFGDTAIKSPFAYWHHLHRFEPIDDKSSTLEDQIEYALPAGKIGNWLGNNYVEKQLTRLFRYRHAVTASDLDIHARYADRPRLKIAITGSSGLIGSALTRFLTTGGHEVVPLKRSKIPGALWDFNRVDADVVVHLAGESVAGRWNVTKKEAIRSSRIEGTESLSAILASQENPPKTLICASATGYYGSRGEDILEETSGQGSGFLAEVCRDWEKSTARATERGIRTVHLRTGMVLTPQGGALAAMLPAFQTGMAGRLGSGNQYWSWIALDDVLGAIYHAIMHDEIAGAMNATAPTPVTNAAFTKTLGGILHRPTFFSVPSSAIRTLFGESAEPLLLGGARVLPRILLETGYVFRHPELEKSLRYLLGR